ncbi:hypothetical protein J2S41_006833 [Catenuloplanes atrovinosus]|uniref:Uncharacterized protein n=1 Tax=Catenuloplanes atrovinosus TaxID=137266 RepID=A0AAE3YUT4_9ACTN|nr:hypothetical protein [Catenuloplanes atrovinosus]
MDARYRSSGTIPATLRTVGSAAGLRGGSGPQRRIEIKTESGVRRERRTRLGAHDQRGAGRQRADPLAHQVPQATADPVADDRIADRLGNDEAGARRIGGVHRLDRLVLLPLAVGLGGETGGREMEVDDDGSARGTTASADRYGEVAATPQSLRCGQHD